MPPLARLRAYLDGVQQEFEAGSMRHGCLLGNLCAEGYGGSELIRNRIVEMFYSLQCATASCLHAAQLTRELDTRVEVAETACFIVSSLQGALLLAKTQDSIGPLQQCAHQLMQCFPAYLPEMRLSSSGRMENVKQPDLTAATIDARASRETYRS